MIRPRNNDFPGPAVALDGPASASGQANASDQPERCATHIGLELRLGLGLRLELGLGSDASVRVIFRQPNASDAVYRRTHQ